MPEKNQIGDKIENQNLKLKCGQKNFPILFFVSCCANRNLSNAIYIILLSTRARKTTNGCYYGLPIKIIKIK